MSEARILLDHGSGGRATRDLIQEVFLSRLGNRHLDALEDAADLEPLLGRPALTVDCFVVDPLFFPGGDIGSLSVHGAVNDLSMRGARPVALSVGFIIEEGLPLSVLGRVVDSLAQAARDAGVLVAAGDTKVVGQGGADKLFITVTGLGAIPEGRNISVHRARPGDKVLLSGPVGNHGLAILTARAGLNLTSPVESDSAALNGLVEDLLAAAGPGVRSLRDPTRGGLAAVLNEIAVASKVGLEVEEARIPLDPAVRAGSELLGLDPLHLANEGKLVAVVAPEAAEMALAALKSHPLGRRAEIVGRVSAGPAGRVVLRTLVGGTRVLDLPFGQVMPRIC